MILAILKPPCEVNLKPEGQTSQLLPSGRVSEGRGGLGMAMLGGSRRLVRGQARASKPTVRAQFGSSFINQLGGLLTRRHGTMYRAPLKGFGVDIRQV